MPITKPSPKPALAAPRKAPAPIVSTGFWLMKSEPDVFSWDMLVARGKSGEPWTGVRNYLARNNMKAMGLGDLGFFYHSNIGKEVVGILKISKLARPEPGDQSGQWACVDVEAVCPLPKPVTLAQVKDDPELQKMSLLTSARLSVQPVTADEWAHVCKLGGLAPTTLAPATLGAAKSKKSKK